MNLLFAVMLPTVFFFQKFPKVHICEFRIHKWIIVYKYPLMTFWYHLTVFSMYKLHFSFQIFQLEMEVPHVYGMVYSHQQNDHKRAEFLSLVPLIWWMKHFLRSLLWLKKVVWIVIPDHVMWWNIRTLNFN